MTGLSSKGETTRSSPPLTTTAYVSLHTADPTDTGVPTVMKSAAPPMRVRAGRLHQRRQQSDRVVEQRDHHLSDRDRRYRAR